MTLVASAAKAVAADNKPRTDNTQHMTTFLLSIVSLTQTRKMLFLPILLYASLLASSSSSPFVRKRKVSDEPKKVTNPLNTALTFSLCFVFPLVYRSTRRAIFGILHWCFTKNVFVNYRLCLRVGLIN